MPILTMTVYGEEEVARNLAKHGKNAIAKLVRGLKKGALHIQRESQLQVPVDFGPLKGSAFTRQIAGGNAPAIAFGYTASYAMFVHEALMTGKGLPRQKPSKGNYWDPAGRAKSKFLEDPFRDEIVTVQELIKEELMS